MRIYEIAPQGQTLRGGFDMGRDPVEGAKQ